MKKFGTKARNTIAIMLILTFACMFVPIQHMIHAEENPQSTQETQNKGYLDSYTEMYGWEQVESIRPLTQKIQNKRTRSARSADAKTKEVQYLAILIEFPDEDMKDIHLDDEYTLKAADIVMNSGGVNIQPLGVEIPVVSLKHYLNQYSYGTFRTHTSFYPKNDVGTTISHTSKKPRTYYMKKTASNPNGYAPDQQASREEELLEEVLQAVKPSIEKELSSAQLDTNNDGFIDAVSFMVEGKFSDSGIGWGDLLWSHKAERVFSTKISGKTVGAYNLNNVGDSQSPGGVFSYHVNKTQVAPLDALKLNRAGYSVIHHEFLHTLGLPDLYRGTSTGDPVGFYDIMASNNSQNPQAMLSILSHDWLGWGSKLSEITADRQITIQRPKYQDSNEVISYKIYSPFHEKEYFIVEYYQKQDATLNTGRSDGLVVYRVNSTLYTNMEGTTDGLGDFLYVFRPEETSLGAAAGNLKDAVILPTVGNTYGKTIDETGDTWDKNTLYYSNGKNSGIKLEVTASDADSITLNVAVPQVKGSGTKGDPFLVSSVDDWNLLVRDNKYIKIMKDIDFNHTAVTSIDNFSGHIDGNGKILFNMTVNGSGIFESISGGSVKNLTLSNINITGSERGHAGGFAGTISGGNIDNVILTSGTVTGGNGANGVGGFVGYLSEGASIQNSFSSLAVSNGQNVGGFIGLTTGGKVENSFANGQVQKAANSNSGGFYGSLFVGSIAPTFTGCAYDMRATGHNTADNQGDIAGITGYQSPETITLDIGGTNQASIDVVTKPILQTINSNVRLGSTAIANFDQATQKLYGVSEGNTTLYVDVTVGTNQMPLATQVQVTNTGAPTKPIVGVSVTPNTLQLERGSTSTLTVTIMPVDTTDSRTITWTSDNDAIVSVDTNGRITAKSAGTAAITATTSNGLKSTCTVTVLIPSTSIQVSENQVNLIEGQSKKVTAGLLPTDTTDQASFTWSSADNTIATVDQDGNITGIKEGNTQVFVNAVLTRNSSFTATIDVTVSANAYVRLQNKYAQVQEAINGGLYQNAHQALIQTLDAAITEADVQLKLGEGNATDKDLNTAYDALEKALLNFTHKDALNEIQDLVLTDLSRYDASTTIEFREKKKEAESILQNPIAALDLIQAVLQDLKTAKDSMILLDSAVLQQEIAVANSLDLVQYLDGKEKDNFIVQLADAQNVLVNATTNAEYHSAANALSSARQELEGLKKATDTQISELKSGITELQMMLNNNTYSDENRLQIEAAIQTAWQAVSKISLTEKEASVVLSTIEQAKQLQAQELPNEQTPPAGTQSGSDDGYKGQSTGQMSQVNEDKHQESIINAKTGDITTLWSITAIMVVAICGITIFIIITIKLKHKEN